MTWSRLGLILLISAAAVLFLAGCSQIGGFIGDAADSKVEYNDAKMSLSHRVVCNDTSLGAARRFFKTKAAFAHFNADCAVFYPQAGEPPTE